MHPPVNRRHQCPSCGDIYTAPTIGVWWMEWFRDCFDCFYRNYLLAEGREVPAQFRHLPAGDTPRFDPELTP